MKRFSPFGEVQIGAASDKSVLWSGRGAAFIAQYGSLPGFLVPDRYLNLDNVSFGWQGDWDDPMSPNWPPTVARVVQALENPGTDDAFVRAFTDLLFVMGPGQTGAVPFNPTLTEQLKGTILSFLRAEPTGLMDFFGLGAPSTGLPAGLNPATYFAGAPLGSSGVAQASIFSSSFSWVILLAVGGLIALFFVRR
jgi:hypothetical protein